MDGGGEGGETRKMREREREIMNGWNVRRGGGGL